MRNLAALTMFAAFLTLGAAGTGVAAPLAPVGAAGLAAPQGSIEDVRWVKRCRNVRVLRHGHRVTVRRCSRVWVR